MTLGDFIKENRTKMNMSRNALAVKAGISHTEIMRIETNQRRLPSLKVLCSIADALCISHEEILKYAGYSPSDDLSPIERVFPGLKTQKQQETASLILEGIARNSSLKDEDLDDLYKQVEMFLNYANEKNSK